MVCIMRTTGLAGSSRWLTRMLLAKPTHTEPGLERGKAQLDMQLRPAEASSLCWWAVHGHAVGA